MQFNRKRRQVMIIGILACLAPIVSRAQDQPKEDLPPEIAVLSHPENEVRSDNLDECLRLYRVAFEKFPASMEVHRYGLRIVDLLGFEGEYDRATRLSVEAFDALAEKSDGVLISVYQFAMAVAKFGPPSSDPDVVDRVLPIAIDRFEESLPESRSTSTYPLTELIRVRAQSLPYDEANALAGKDLSRASQYYRENPESTEALGGYIQSLRNAVLISVGSDEIDEELLSELLARMDELAAKPTSRPADTYFRIALWLGPVIERCAVWNPSAAEQVMQEAKARMSKLESGDPSIKALATQAIIQMNITHREGSIAKGRAIRQLVGRQAPDFNVTAWLNSKPMTIEDLRGKVVLLEFWEMYCGPCRQVFPIVSQWKDRYQEQGLVVIGHASCLDYRWDAETDAVEKRDEDIPTDEELDTLSKFMKHHRLSSPLMVSDNESTLKDDYSLVAKPQFVLIDKQGVVRQVQLGFDVAHLTELEQMIKQLIAE